MKIGVLVLVVAGCGQKSDETKVVARIGNRVISAQEVDERISKLPPFYQNLVLRNRARYLDDLVVQELFYEEAIRQGIDKDKETRDIIKEARKKVITAKYIKQEVEDKITIDDAAVRAYYDGHQDEFLTRPMWRVSHILVAGEDEARAIQRGVNAGELDFEATARSRSLDHTAKRGGDIGYFARGQLIPEFEEVCVRLDEGGPAGVVKTQFGYHVVKLTEKKPPQMEEFDKVKKFIEDKLRQEERKKLFNSLIADLKEKYKVSVSEEIAKEGEEGQPPAASPAEGSPDEESPLPKER